MNTGDAMMHRFDLKNCATERGVALVSALIVVSVAAGLFAAIMYFALTGTEISGLQRKYQSSREASLGAIDVLTKDLLPRVMGGTNLSAAVSALVKPAAVMPAITADAAKDCLLHGQAFQGNVGLARRDMRYGDGPYREPRYRLQSERQGRSDKTVCG